jgi:hypothetical protein
MQKLSNAASWSSSFREALNKADFWIFHFSQGRLVPVGAEKARGGRRVTGFVAMVAAVEWRFLPAAQAGRPFFHVVADRAPMTTLANPNSTYS